MKKQQPVIEQFSSYKSILLEVGKQLSQRKGLLVRRVFVYSWPMLIITGLLSWLHGEMGEIDVLEKFLATSTPQFWLAIALVLIAVAIYVGTLSAVFAIEKRIWIDSYFDGKNLTSTESWRIARKLLVPLAGFWTTIFFRFYFLGLLIFAVVSISTSLVLVYSPSLSEDSAKIATLTVWSVGAVILWIYIYYVQLHQRFLWFIFLDLYGTTDYSLSAVLKEQGRLNKIAKAKGFIRGFVVNASTDAALVITNMSISQITLGLEMAVGMIDSTAGRVVGDVARKFGSELAGQAASLGNIAAMHILYRETRMIDSGKLSVVNTALYKLAQ